MALSWRQLDGEWVVFDSGSGNTHRLPALLAGVLFCLEDGPLDEASLTQSLAEIFPAQAHAELGATLTEALGQLSVLELAAPRP